MNARHSAKLNPREDVSEFFKLLGKINLPMSIPATVPSAMMHIGIGSRYLTWWRFVTAAILVTGSFWLWTVGIKLFNWIVLPAHQPNIFSIGFLVLSLSCAVSNKALTIIQKWRGMAHHAWDRGQSILDRLRLPSYLTYALIEPLLWLSLAVWIPCTYTRCWLIIGGITLLIHTNIDFYLYRWSADDRSSSQVEASEHQTRTVEHASYVTTVAANQK